MKSLSDSDAYHLRAAFGWLELGSDNDAVAELEKIAWEDHSHPEVLRARFEVFAKLRKWDLALLSARTTTEQVPGDVMGWLLQARALRRLRRVEEAFILLRDLREIFPRSPELFYDLASYAALLGKVEEADDWLQRAFGLGNRECLKKQALKDPDLQELWAAKGG